MRTKLDLAGKVAVIAGETADIGLALALRAADEGMKVALADIDESRLADALEQVRAKGVAAISVRAQLSDIDSVRMLAQRTETELGPPWLVCNNSAVGTRGRSSKLGPKGLRRMMDANLWAVINGVQVFAPGMSKRDAGHIVNVASAAAMFGVPGTAHHVAAAHAIVGLSEALYRELDSMGSRVGVTVVCPGVSATNVAGNAANRTMTRARAAPENMLPPKELAEAIFTAVALRRFNVSPHSRPLWEISTSTTLEAAGSVPERVLTGSSALGSQASEALVAALPVQGSRTRRSDDAQSGNTVPAVMPNCALAPAVGVTPGPLTG